MEERVARAAPGDIRRIHELQAAVVAAGLDEVFDPEEGWLTVRVVTGPVKPDLSRNQIHVDQLPPGVESILYREIMTLGVDGEEWARLLASFPARPGNG
jgi:hypothetical protein